MTRAIRNFNLNPISKVRPRFVSYWNE